MKKQVVNKIHPMTTKLVMLKNELGRKGFYAAMHNVDAVVNALVMTDLPRIKNGKRQKRSK